MSRRHVQDSLRIVDIGDAIDAAAFAEIHDFDLSITGRRDVDALAVAIGAEVVEAALNSG